MELPLPLPRWSRIIIAIVAGEVLPILTLVLVVALYGFVAHGPGTLTPEAVAQIAGLWVGPIAGAVVAFGGGWWAGQASASPVRQAVIIGAGIAAIDLTILVLAGEALRPLFLLSNLGKLGAAVAGGFGIAYQQRRRAAMRKLANE